MLKDQKRHNIIDEEINEHRKKEIDVGSHIMLGD